MYDDPPQYQVISTRTYDVLFTTTDETVAALYVMRHSDTEYDDLDNLGDYAFYEVA